MRKGTFAPLALALCFAFAGTSAAQEPESETHRYTVDVDLAEFRVLVKEDGKYTMKDLTSDNFRVYLNCKEKDAKKRAEKCKAVEIKVSSQNLPPGSWLIILDESGTMIYKNTIESARRALPQIATITREGDEFALWTFGERMSTVIPWTGDLNAINAGMQNIKANKAQSTLILDALYQSLLEMAAINKGKRTKWIFLLSDLKIDPGMVGGRLVENTKEGFPHPCPQEHQRWDSPRKDKCRRVTYGDITAMLLKLDVGLYIFDYSKRSGRKSERFEVQTDEFAKVVALAEGRIFPVKGDKDSGKVFDELAKWLDVVYVVEFKVEAPPGEYWPTIDAGITDEDGKFVPREDWTTLYPRKVIKIEKE